MNIAIIGGTGLLGSNLVNLYAKRNINVLAFSRADAANIQSKYNQVIDFTNLESSLNNSFETFRPNIIINAIALVNLEKCEEDIDLCQHSNVDIAKVLAHLAKEYKSYFIHISTDHFYQDTILKHTEKEPLILRNNYARTKKEAERQVLKINFKTLIVRTNIIGFRRTQVPSFFEWLLHALENQTPIHLFKDFFTSPIDVKILGDLLLQCYEKKLTGVYNIASSEVINKYTFGLEMAKVFNFSSSCIQESSIIEFQKNSSIQRATSLGLDVTKIEIALGVSMPSIETTLKNLLAEYTGDNSHG